MTAKWLVVPAAVLLLMAGAACAADYRLETIKQAAPADDISPEIAAALAPTGFKVVQGEKRTLCEIWLAKTWTVTPGFQPSDSVLYPLAVGEFIGVLRFPRKGSDFRGQEIAAGMYTLRYANQPVDGNHVGTSPTRDFLLLSPAKSEPADMLPALQHVEEGDRWAVQFAGGAASKVVLELVVVGKATE
jgi:hypothetical protein